MGVNPYDPVAADQQQAEQAPQDQSQQAQDQQGRSPEEVERLRREAEEARKREEELRELVRLSLQQSYSSSTPQPSHPYGSPGQVEDEDIEIPEDFDATDPKAVAKLVKEVAKKQAEKMAQQLASSYSSDRQQQLTLMAMQQWENFKQRMTVLGRTDLIQKVESYLRENQIPPENLVAPDAYDGIAAYIIGQEVYRQQVLAPRPPNLSATGQVPQQSSAPQVPEDVVSEFKRLVGDDVQIDLDELARIAEKGEMDPDDYRRVVKQEK